MCSFFLPANLKLMKAIFLLFLCCGAQKSQDKRDVLKMGSVGRKPPSGEGTRCLAMLVAQIFLTLTVNKGQ